MTAKEKAAIIELLDVHHIEDHIYYLKDRVHEDFWDFKGESWEHPTVKAFGKLCSFLRKAVK